MEKQRKFIDFAISGFLRRKGKNAALILVYALIIFLLASVMLFAGAIRKEAQALLQDAPEIVVQKLVAGRHDLIPLHYLEKIEGIRGVRSVKGRLWGYYYHPASRATYTIMVPDAFQYAEADAVVGDGVLKSWGSPGVMELYLKAFDGTAMVLTIADAFDASTALVSSDLILVSEAAFRKLFGIPDALVTDLAVEVRNQKECPIIAEKIVRMLPDTRPILRQEILRTYASVFDWRSGYVMVLLSGALLAFFIFAWDKATGLSAEEKGEIGILKALGWDTSDVLTLKVWEGIVVSLTAFLIGFLAAYVHIFFTPAVLFQHAIKGWSVLYPRFDLHPFVDLYHIAVLFFLTVVPYTVITLVPSWRVAVTDPDTVMRL